MHGRHRIVQLEPGERSVIAEAAEARQVETAAVRIPLPQVNALRTSIDHPDLAWIIVHDDRFDLAVLAVEIRDHHASG